VTRAVKAVVKGGVEVERVEIEPGKITVIARARAEDTSLSADDELARWRRKSGHAHQG
jgi:hypothetical protein